MSASPALASESIGGHNGFSVEALTVGVFADIDYSCLETDPNFIYENLGWNEPPQLPSGLSYDETTHHIAGTPTQTGTFPLPLMNCVFKDSTGNVLSIGGQGTGTIVVSDPPAPATPPGATIILDPLNNAGCEFAMTLIFPTYWDAGSMSVEFASGSSSVTVHDKDIDRLIGHWIVEPSNPEVLSTTYSDDWSSTFEKVSNNPSCGELMTVTVNYNVAGVPAETATDSIRPIQARTRVNADLYVESGKCSIDLDYELEDRVFDSGNYDGPVFVELESITGRAKVDFVLQETSPGDEGRLTVNLTDGVMRYAQINGITLNLDNFPVTATGNFSCGVAVEVTLSGVTWPGADTSYLESTFANPLTPCGKGTWNSDSLGFLSSDFCPYAPIGSYVDTVGATVAKTCPIGMTTLEMGSTTIKDCFYPGPECGKGTFSPSGHDLADAPCLDAPVGSYVSVKGAMVSTDCPGSMTTEAPGAASVYDCFTPAPATIAKLKTPKAAKFGLPITLLGQTDQGTNLNITGSGACSVIPIPNGVSQKFKVTMGKKAGICKLTVTAKPRGRFTGLNKTISIKVSKTGK